MMAVFWKPQPLRLEIVPSPRMEGRVVDGGPGGAACRGRMVVVVVVVVSSDEWSFVYVFKEIIDI